MICSKIVILHLLHFPAAPRAFHSNNVRQNQSRPTKTKRDATAWKVVAHDLIIWTYSRQRLRCDMDSAAGLFQDCRHEPRQMGAFHIELIDPMRSGCQTFNQLPVLSCVRLEHEISNDLFDFSVQELIGVTMYQYSNPEKKAYVTVAVSKRVCG